jgi:hypothetical protein
MNNFASMKRKLSAGLQSSFIQTLQYRFEKNMNRHPHRKWNDILANLQKQEQKIWSLYQMEITGGEPDVTHIDDNHQALIFMDCSPDTPLGRRSLCYDDEALQKRKLNKPLNSALKMAEEMGVQLLDETQYRILQRLGSFDNKTSSWIATPSPIRALGGALFCDRRFDTVFTYHNTAESYYASRGFRSLLLI